MPELARITCHMQCPYCSHIEDTLMIQWGMVPSCSAIGDEVPWLYWEGTLAPAWTLKISEGKWNAGDPRIIHLFVRDNYLFHPEYGYRRNCPLCNNLNGGAVVEIKDNRFISARIILPGEMPEYDYLKVDRDNKLIPIIEWQEKSIHIIDG